ncbi:DUF2987 domain-containing protein [Vibrio cincinnatiensis]|uniref:DUF2987 domain-containing protein n=1 Tax=Vibrio cincinnatiensis TaxID=675 RepID=UPI001EDD6D00|nr:DUF2987 domain-containing protein [Vibrio cincinnatiensis]MCG3728384.1 DUF2987 domain-containing protein [Vibrio cincinnatiensis]
MRLPTTLLLSCLSLGASLPTQAQEYMFTYSKLFSQLKYNTKEQYSDVKVGIFFVNAENKQLCPIEKAWMEKEAHYELLPSNKIHELLLPLDNHLRQANPLVFVDTPNDQPCDFSVVVLSKKPLKGLISYQEIEQLLPQMQSLLQELGGMFARWFTPQVAGVTLEFAKEAQGRVELSRGEWLPIIDGKVQITLEQIGEDGWIRLPIATQRVLPFLPKAGR